MATPMNDSDSAHEHYLRAMGLEDEDRLAARSAYEACLAGDCSHLEARINLGRLLHLEGLHSEAEKIYRETELADATLLFNIAVLMEDLAREGEAVKYYQEALVHDPGLADAHFNLAMLQERRGEAQGAYRHLLAYHRLLRAHENPADFVEDSGQSDLTP
jgi:tetratricopeptide (TPR) repeat protein